MIWILLWIECAGPRRVLLLLLPLPVAECEVCIECTVPEDETTDVGRVCERDARGGRGRAEGTVPDAEDSTECVKSEGDGGPRAGDALTSEMPSL